MSGPVVTYPEDVVNAALSRLGRSIRVGNLLEGSEVAKAALDIYGQTRDQLLRSDDWGFARRDVTMAATKTGLVDYTVTPWSIAYPPYPWRYQFAYPADCLKVRNVVSATPGFALNFDPQPPRWETPNAPTGAQATPVAKVIVSNVGPSAVLIYTGQITDPATWEPSFTEAMIDALCERLAPALSKLGPEAAKLEQPQAAMAEARATMTQG